MNKLIYIHCILFLALCSCSDQRHQKMQEWMTQNGKVKVLSTIGMINDLVKEVGGNYVDTFTLISEQLDPHSYQLVKGDDEKLAYAQLIFYNGLNLEHGPSLLYHLVNNNKAIPLGERLMNDSPNLIMQVNSQIDPHIWMDISLWQRIVPYIVEELSLIDPSHSNIYRERGEILQNKLMDTHLQVKTLLHEVPQEKRYLVTSHDAFNYFARAYLSEEGNHWQERFVAPEGLAPDSRLSTQDIQMIIDHLQKYKIRVIFSESNVSKDSIRKIVNAGKEKGLDVIIATCYLYGDAMGGVGSDGDTYTKMIMHNAKTIKSFLLEEQIEGCDFNPKDDNV